MAKKTTSTEDLEDHEAVAPARLARVRQSLSVLRRWALRAIFACAVIFAGWGLAYRWLNPPITLYMMQESWRLDGIQYDWVDIEDVAPIMVRVLVASEDANFCAHWGIDSAAVRQALRDGAMRGGSTISQQTAKNVFLWQGGGYARKAAEAWFTLLIEQIWGKRRIMEVYLNVAETGIGTYGAEAGAQRYFDKSAADLSQLEAARMAAALPLPKERSVVNPSGWLRRHGNTISARIGVVGRDALDACVYQ